MDRNDLIFLGILLLFTIPYFYHVSQYQVPIWDGAAYLANAQDWKQGNVLYENLRAPLVSWMMDFIWLFTGESYGSEKYLHSIFIIGSAMMAYIVIKKHSKKWIAFGTSFLFLINPYVFHFGTHLYTEGIALFFLLLSFYFIESQKKYMWIISGIFAGLTFAARYTIIVQILPLLLLQSLRRKRLRMFLYSMSSAFFVIFIVLGIIYMNTGTVQLSNPKDNAFGLPKAYYLVNSFEIFGIMIIFLPIAFFKPDDKDFLFIAWMFLGMIFWSMNQVNQQSRFMIPTMIPIYYFCMRGIENLYNWVVRSKVKI